MRWAVVLLIAGRVLAEPTPGRLDPTPPPSRDGAAARMLPPTTTVCQDRRARRCWTVGGGSLCTTERADATEFRRVLAADVADALADCERELATLPAP